MPLVAQMEHWVCGYNSGENIKMLETTTRVIRIRKLKNEVGN